MTQYIDKAAVVAEIERIEYETNYEPFTDEVLGTRNVCRKIREFLDTLEVKEVDLNDEKYKYLNNDGNCIFALNKTGKVMRCEYINCFSKSIERRITMQHYTTIEQSKKLVELGFNPKTADICYPHFIRHGADTYDETPEIAEDIDYPYEMPCWSLGALIGLMPAMIYKGGETFTLRVYKDTIYHVCYRSHYHLDEIWFSKENLLDAAFEMVCWLLENGYIKKGE